jgi:hypothetical protein
LFARLQDAKLQVDFANVYAKEIRQDIQEGTVEIEEAHNAHKRALQVSGSRYHLPAPQISIKPIRMAARVKSAALWELSFVWRR